LAVVVVLPRALQADHQDRGGRIVDLERAGVALAGQHMDKLVMDDLDHLLAGGDRFGDRLAGGLLAPALMKSRATGSETSASRAVLSATRTSRRGGSNMARVPPGCGRPRRPRGRNALGGLERRSAPEPCLVSAGRTRRQGLGRAGPVEAQHQPMGFGRAAVLIGHPVGRDHGAVEQSEGMAPPPQSV
jgi:hypothetical protein